MCASPSCPQTGLTVLQHQETPSLQALLAEDLPMPIMPVIQATAAGVPDHIHVRGSGVWHVGVGSVCKRNRQSIDVANVLRHSSCPARLKLRLRRKKTALLIQLCQLLQPRILQPGLSGALRARSQCVQEADKFDCLPKNRV
jgi:hypothetical protein